MFPMAAITNYYKLSGLKLHKTSDIVAEVRSLKWVYWVKKSRCCLGLDFFVFRDILTSLNLGIC